MRAGKEATIGVALRDLRRDRMWRSEVRQREMRQLAVLEGLDPRDRDYERHRAGAMSREEFEHWQRQPPQLAMSALVATLVESGGTDEGPQMPDPELLAEALPTAPPSDRVGTAGDAAEIAAGPGGIMALAPGAGPDIGSARAEQRPSGVPPLIGPRLAPRPGTAVERTDLTAALDSRLASVVRLEAGSRRGNGFYVRPRLVVTAADLVGSASVIDVITSQGEAGLGLVVHTDPDRNIAVVHVPRAGRPALLSEASIAGPGHRVEVLELIEPGQARLTHSVLTGANGVAALRLEPEAAAADTSMGAPVFLHDRAIALVAPLKGAPERNFVPIGALDELLESGSLAALH